MTIKCFNTTATTLQILNKPNNDSIMTLPHYNHTNNNYSSFGGTNSDISNSKESGQEDPRGALVKFVFMDILIPVVCGLGLVGNLLSLVVLTTEKMHRTLTKMEISAHIGLIALAVSDFLFCLLVLVFTQVSHQAYYEPDDAMLYFVLLADGTITIFIIFSTWLIVVMAAERYIAVCHPLRARKVISLRRTRAVIAIVFVVCVLATIPIFLERSIEEVVCHDGRKVLQLRRRSQQSQKLRRILWAVFFDFIPCIALIYFNMCLIIQIRKAKKLRDGLAPTHYTFQANKPQSTSRANTRDIYKTNGRDHALSNALLKSNHTHNNKHGLDLESSVGGGGTVGSTRMGKGTGPGQDRYTRLTIGGGRSPNSYHSHNSSRSSEDSASTNSHQTTPPRKLAGKRMITMNGTGSVVKKRPSDSALNSVTATLVAVVLLFLILVSPSELLKFSLSYTESDSMNIVKNVTNFMQVLNFSLNFVLYCAVNKTFRHTLRGLACCCWLSITG